MSGRRDMWNSRLGVILAMAGNAVGLGNFLRFPTQAAQNGGGAFLIPYFVALLLIGLPLMWCEWAMGRYGGGHGRGSAPGVLHLLSGKPWARYLGVLGVVLPLTVLCYYLYIMSWTMAYAVSFLLQQGPAEASLEVMRQHLVNFQGVNTAAGVSLPAYAFFLVSTALTYLVLVGGISKGIERLSMWGMPLLFIMGILLVIRVLTLPPHASTPAEGLGFLWNPDFSKLKDGRVWLAAAGQVFFTLSLGFGCVISYASYLRRKDDVVVTGFSTVSANEFAEVILGGSIAITAAVVFFGVQATQDIAKGGSFDLGFVAMPAVFVQMPGGAFFGVLWFVLLFIAGITSAVALCQPAVTFLEDELKWSHARAVRVVAGVAVLLAHIPVLGCKYGALDELDFWAGKVGIVVFALVELIFFIWVFGPRKAWNEIHEGAEVPLPRIFYPIICYVAPALLLVILVTWVIQEDPSVWLLSAAKGPELAWKWGARLMIIGLIAVTAFLIRRSWRRVETSNPEAKP